MTKHCLKRIHVCLLFLELSIAVKPSQIYNHISFVIIGNPNSRQARDGKQQVPVVPRIPISSPRQYRADPAGDQQLLCLN